jgi:hypothetical protein
MRQGVPPAFVVQRLALNPKTAVGNPLANVGKQAMARVSELFGQPRSSYLLGDRATSKNPLRTANWGLESSANCRF